MAAQQQFVSESLPQSLWRAEDVQAIEQQWAALADNNLVQLMQQAGIAAFGYLSQRWPSTQRLLVFAGGGNNGGDAYVLAHLAILQGWQVQLVALAESSRLPEAAAQARKVYLQAGGTQSCVAEIDWQVDIIVDGLLGIGLHGNVRPKVQALIESINQSGLPVLALDIPSGLNADNGQIMGVAIQAAATISFVALKQGLVTGQAAAVVGDIVYASLGVPLPDVVPVQLFTPKTPPWHFPKRHPCAHKGLHGRITIVGGNHSMAGAVRLAGEACLRSGAGLVTLLSRPEHAASINAACPELMLQGIDDVNMSLVDGLLAQDHVLVLGPGLGLDDWARALWHHATSAKLPSVIDADGLHWLAQSSLYSEQWVLSPHPKEAAHLLHCSVGEVEQDRFAAAQSIQQQYGGVCVLKGAGTVIAGANNMMAVAKVGNAGMATAGMGDVLSGIIGALIGQFVAQRSLFDLACMAVWIHGMAGDLAAGNTPRGMLASDLMLNIRQIVNNQ